MQFLSESTIADRMFEVLTDFAVEKQKKKVWAVELIKEDLKTRFCIDKAQDFFAVTGKSSFFFFF